jgi:hypothetical protein
MQATSAEQVIFPAEPGVPAGLLVIAVCIAQAFL